jgi:hypothetical protein
MGYECPVCSAPQADERHLADHLAMTALTRGGDHESWLDERVPDWEGMGPGELGPLAAEEATEREFPQMFEDTTEGHQHGDSLEEEIARSGRRGPGGRDDLTAETREALSEAREMTEEMLERAENEAEDDETRDDEE